VDITTTGSTLRANGLKVLDDGVILKSEAHLVASLAASWDARRRRILGAVMKRMGVEHIEPLLERLGAR
jgi:ATP phosphoribosyltransferase